MCDVLRLLVFHILHLPSSLRHSWPDRIQKSVFNQVRVDAEMISQASAEYFQNKDKLNKLTEI